MKIFKILIFAAFVLVISACHDKDKTIYEYPDEDSTPAEKGNIGDPCIRNNDCKEGLLCIDKVCSEPAADEDTPEDSDIQPDEEEPTDDADSDTTPTDDTDTAAPDEDEPEDTDTQPDEDSDTTPYNPECGNGIVEMGEECDDGFANSDEPGEYNLTCRTNCRFARCGDSITDSGEACDDGNRFNGDYCSDDCRQIIGWCGDGKQQNNEECDYKENLYCTQECTAVSGSCGDGIVNGQEACDNAEPGEGGGQGIGSYCSDDCRQITGWCGDGIKQVEVGEVCDDGADNGKYGHCNTKCTAEVFCGDGIVQAAYEKCDDGNNEDKDYCSPDCQTLHGSCGDGIKQSFEECDNADPNEGGKQGIGAYCSDDCKHILGECGDGTVNTEAGEECDEGSNPNTYCEYGTVTGCEVCSSNCRKTAGTRRWCGDGIRQSEYEACDTGVNPYCSEDCQRIEGYCGDGKISHGEVCDPNKTDDPNSPYCSSDCKNIVGSCGDGEKNGNEECDYGTNNGKKDCDYGPTGCTVCTTECKEENGTPHYCGDTNTDTANGEKCDEGDDNGKTDCTYGEKNCKVCDTECQKVDGIPHYCGDTNIDTANGEQCDLGDGVNGTITDCAYDEESCKVCNAECKEVAGNTSTCGDGKLDTANEACDKADPSVGIGQGIGAYCADNCQNIVGSCGDGKIQPNEACDKADPGVGDGEGTGAYCSFDCTQSYGYCGDGETLPGVENCDDGANNGKYNPTTQSHYCNSSCTAKDSGYCGDSMIQNSSCGGDPDCSEMPDAAEECDYGSDNGKINCDYDETSCTVCNSNCKLRDGVTSRCGDGKLDTANEACDKADPSVGEHQGIGAYCADDCKSVTGSCGDGTQQTNEACDKAEPNVGEGQGIGAYCSSNCQNIVGSCGDGTKQNHEACDNADPSVGEHQGIGAYCSDDCQTILGSCGNGTVDANEQCDNADPGVGEGQGIGAYCSDDCQTILGSCGDGKIQTNEACDNADPSVGEHQGTGAYCSFDCSQSYGYCGDGSTLEGVETCDDGGNNGTYNHCNSNCDGYMERCGDTTIDSAYGEICDEGDGINGTYNHCSSNCKYIMECGNGRTESQYENCDDGENNGKYNYCNTGCSKITGYCGDGKLQRTDCEGFGSSCITLEGGNEECDNGDANGSTYCTYGETSCEVCTKSCTPEVGKPAYCGDKKIQKGTAEACDAYVALDPVNNKLCDEDITENCCEVVSGTNEACDDGDENGNFGKCDTTCSEIVTWRCGDGTVDGEHGETCDDGDEFNGTSHHCNSTCTGPTLFCGDGIIQQEICTWVPCDEENTLFCCEIVEGMHEACDHGDNNGQPGYCYSDCTGYCGDGKVQEGHEACDEGYGLNGQPGHCNQICSGTTAVCGNGIVEYGEACDDGNTVDNDYCSADCLRETGYCGDGTKQDNEICDEGEENNGYHGHCNEECDGSSVCGDGRLGKDEFCDGTEMFYVFKCSELPQFSLSDETKMINSCTADCVPDLTQCEYNDSFIIPFFKTGQTLCYSNDGITACHESALPFFGQEPEFVYKAHSYDTSIANIIQDNSTGLMWQKDTPAIYEGEIEGYHFSKAEGEKWEARYYCRYFDLGGYNDWRLPTAAELSTITDYSSATHIYSGFTNTTGSYWTDEGLVFSTADGTFLPSTETAKIKCVRSVNEESGCTSLQCREKRTAESVLVFDSPNTVITFAAGSESEGLEIFADFWHFEDLDNGDTWENALATCIGFNNLNGLDEMRLPTVNELMWLIDRTNGGSLIPGFTGTAWTSTTVPGNMTKAYAVKFSDGSVISESKTNSNIVICIE